MGAGGRGVVKNKSEGNACRRMYVGVSIGVQVCMYVWGIRNVGTIRYSGGFLLQKVRKRVTEK